MSITKAVQIDGVELGFHRVTRIVFHRNGPCLAMVSSWVSEASAQGRPYRTEGHALPQNPTPGIAMFDDAEQLLVADSEGAFFGGTFAADPAPATELDMAKLAKWREVKAERSRREYGLFTASTGHVLSISQSEQIRLQAVYSLAVDAKAANTPFSVDWTLADESTVTLNANQMIALGKQVYAYLQELQATAQALRQQIVAATSIEEVSIITWPG